MSTKLICDTVIFNNPIFAGIYGGASQIACIVATAGVGSIPCTLTTFSAYRAAWKLYDEFVSADDHRLIAKLGGKDCGGLSKISVNVEGCFRKYVGEAICRLTEIPAIQDESINFPMLENRFNECFSNRQEHPCDDWFFRTDVFASDK